MNKLFPFIILLLSAFNINAQQDSTEMVKFGSGVHFAEGVYANFNEWKNNQPRINDFHAVKTNAFGAQDEIELRYNCKGDNGSMQSCVVNNCFGYVLNGAFYITQGFNGHYFRVFIIGGLTHFIAYSGYEDPDAYYTSDPNGLIGAANDYREYVLDFSNGEVFEFNYKNFVSFLKANDPELNQQLLASKNKRQMIHHFLLKYNERHPIYLPAH